MDAHPHNGNIMANELAVQFCDKSGNIAVQFCEKNGNIGVQFCEQFVLDGECTQTNMVDDDNYGWQPGMHWEGNKLKATYKYEDSAGTGEEGACGDATNPYQQFGSCVLEVTLDVETTVNYKVDGNVEDHMENFDFGRINRDSLNKVEIHGTNNGNGCDMVNRTDMESEVLSAGTYQFEFEADTNDANFHENMIHHFEIEFVENT